MPNKQLNRRVGCMSSIKQEFNLLKFSLCRLELQLRKVFLRKILFCIFILIFPVIVLLLALIEEICTTLVRLK